LSKIKKIVFIILIINLFTGITYATDFQNLKKDEKLKIISEKAREYKVGEHIEDFNSYMLISDIYYEASDGTIELEEKNNFYNYNKLGWLVKEILPNVQDDVEYIYNNCLTFGEQIDSNLLDIELLMKKIEVGDIIIFGSKKSSEEQVMLYYGLGEELEFDTIYYAGNKVKRINLKDYLSSVNSGTTIPRSMDETPLIGIARPLTIKKANSLVTLLTDGVLYVGQAIEESLVTVLGYKTGNISHSIDSIIFNECPLTRIDYFRDDVTINGESNTWLIQLKQLVSFLYSTEIAIIIIVYIFFLVYIGIKSIVVSIAEDKTKYKESLMAWFIGLLMLLGFNFIMGYIIEANDLLIEFVRSIVENNTITGTMALQDLVSELKETAFNEANVVIGLLWVTLLLKTVMILIKYIKRLITITMLIILFPFVTLGYVLDKIKDGRTKIFDIWFTAFFQNVFINFLDAVVYLIIVQVILDATFDTLLIPVVAVMIFDNISDEIAKLIGINKKAYLSPISATSIISQNSTGIIKELRKNINEMNKKANVNIDINEVNALNSLGKYNSKENRLMTEKQESKKMYK